VIQFMFRHSLKLRPLRGRAGGGMHGHAVRSRRCGKADLEHRSSQLRLIVCEALQGSSEISTLLIHDWNDESYMRVAGTSGTGANQDCLRYCSR